MFGFFDFSENDDFGNFPVGFRVWGGLQSIGNGCGIQIDGFSHHFEAYGFIFYDFHDSVILAWFSVVCRCFRKVPGLSESALSVPEPCESVLSDWSQLVATSRN